MNSYLLLVCIFIMVSKFEASPFRRNCYSFKSEDVSIELGSYKNISDVTDVEVYLNYDTVQCKRDVNFCLTAFNKTSDGKIYIIYSGCWENYEKTCENDKCLGFHKNSTLMTCCCNTNECNKKVFLHNATSANLEPKRKEERQNLDKHNFENISLYSICIIFLIMILIGLIGILSIQLKRRFVLVNQQKCNQTKNSKESSYFSNHKNIDNLILVSIIGEGRFGTVWKGVLNDKPVAIKIFNSSKKQNFYNELDIYTKPLLNRCPQLLSYYGYDERITSDGNKEYLLIVSLAEYGSLHKYLKENIVSFEIFCRMSLSIARGLSYLHSKIIEKNQVKLSICHRDLNPRNIVVKSDFTCALCDFGYAICVDGPRYQYNGDMILAQTKSISEVGTIRYLAPEMLEGSLNLRDCEIALKQTDVYSLGLVLWELTMRCKDFYNIEEIPDYKPAYEDELGSGPTFDQMRNLVLQQKARPKFPEDIMNFDENLLTMKDMCSDLWDHDPDARISSSCVEDRLKIMSLSLIPMDQSPTTSRGFAGFLNEMRMTDNYVYQLEERMQSSEIELNNSTQNMIETQDTTQKDFDKINVENDNADISISSSTYDDRIIDHSSDKSKSRIFNNIFKKPDACFERLKDVASHIKTPGDVPASVRNVRRTNKNNGKQFTLVKKPNVNDM